MTSGSLWNIILRWFLRLQSSYPAPTSSTLVGAQVIEIGFLKGFSKKPGFWVVAPIKPLEKQTPGKTNPWKNLTKLQRSIQ
jgi:hypothetical protein